MRMKNVRIKPAGNSYHIIIPSALVDKTDLLELGVIYDVEFKKQESPFHDLIARPLSLEAVV